MQFLYDLAGAASDKFKDTAEAVWDALGEEHRNSDTIRGAARTAGKYALTAQLAMLLNFPDNAELFRDTFNVTGDGPTGAAGFLEDKSTLSIGRIVGRTAAVSMTNNAQALMAQGFADVSATSTLSDIRKLLPILVAVNDMGDK